MAAVTPFRPHDYVYDPFFVVSGERDYYKAAMVAKLATAKFQICPVFANMFSDLPHRPRKRLIMRKVRITPKFEDVKKKEAALTLAKRGADFLSERVIGADRAKYFHCPIINLPDDSLPYLYSPTFKLQKVKVMRELEDTRKTANKKIQTQYRESYAQTIPWEPDYRIMDNGDPEILKLDFLKWGAGLPAGVHEVQLIERARMKRAWEKALPEVGDAASLEKRKAIIAAMERDEWAFREKEIQDIQDLRLEILEEMLSELHENAKKRTEEKMRMFIQDKETKKTEQLEKLKKRTARELRKLEMQHKGMNPRYHIMDIIEEHVDRKSELYGPLMRHGEHPKRWHQVIDDHLAKYKAQFVGVEHFNTLPRWLNQATQIKGEIKLPGTRLCVRETKWTEPVLRQLHEELKKLRQTVPEKACTLRVRIEKSESEASTPEVEGITDEEEDTYQATIFIQSVLRGRASQMLIYEGRDRCRELIQELRLTHSVKKEERSKINKKQRYIMMQQKIENIRLSKESTLKQHLDKIQGKVVGSLLDFLNKELRRLMDERRAHAMCLLNERDRQYAEAAEAGRRQKELRRRREHDEMFKQIIKVHQDTVDLYLQDIITEDMNFASKREAEIYVKMLSDKIDEANREIDEVAKPIPAQEELIADLVHHFVLPEVEKQMIRKRIIERQKQNLKLVHDALNKEYEHLPKWSKSSIVTVGEGDEDLVDTFHVEDLEYLYTNQNDLDDLTSEVLGPDFISLQGSLSSASIVSNISYIRPKGQGSLTQLPAVQLLDSASEVSEISTNPPKIVSSDIDLTKEVDRTTTYSNIMEDIESILSCVGEGDNVTSTRGDGGTITDIGHATVEINEDDIPTQPRHVGEENNGDVTYNVPALDGDISQIIEDDTTYNQTIQTDEINYNIEDGLANIDDGDNIGNIPEEHHHQDNSMDPNIGDGNNTDYIPEENHREDDTTDYIPRQNTDATETNMEYDYTNTENLEDTETNINETINTEHNEQLHINTEDPDSKANNNE